MEFNGLHTLSLPFAMQDALIAVGAGVALLACLAFINLGTLLPGLLMSLGGPHPDQRGAYLEFGPTGAPVISEPSSSRAAPRSRTSHRGMLRGRTFGDPPQEHRLASDSAHSHPPLGWPRRLWRSHCSRPDPGKGRHTPAAQRCREARGHSPGHTGIS
jgi:hypothetical protein